jgi:hypothetical protein
MLVKLTNTKNESIEIDLPQSMDEVSLSSALSFSIVEREIKELLDNDPDNVIEYFILVTRAVANFLDIDEEWLHGMPMGDVPTTLTKVRKTTFKQATNGIIKLFEYIVTLFEGLKPELYIDREFTFEHKGETYHVPMFITDHLSTNMINPQLTVSEVVEALEVKRLCSKIKDNKNALFTELVKLTAILARKGDEKFPTDQQEINTFIQTRSNLFIDLDAKVGIDIAFFLNSIIII